MTFAEAHPDIAPDFETNEGLKSYKLLDDNGKVVEKWVRDEDTGEMVDITERVLLEQYIADQKEELERLKRREAYLKGRMKESDNS